MRCVCQTFSPTHKNQTKREERINNRKQNAFTDTADEMHNTKKKRHFAQTQTGLSVIFVESVGDRFLFCYFAFSVLNSCFVRFVLT